MKTTYYVILLLVLTVFGCRKDIDSKTTTTSEKPGPVVVGYEPIEQRVAASFEGFVHDQSDQPIANAKITYGTNSVFTNNFGYFVVNSTLLNKYGEAVKVEHPAFFDNVYRIYPSENSTSWHKFKLSEKFSTLISGLDGGIVQIPGGGTLEIMEKSLVTPADTIYTGTVNVAVNSINANAFGNYYSGSGNHFGINQWRQEVVVTSIGMASIEVSTTNGDPLTITDNDSLLPILRISKSPSYTGNLPQTAPLWEFHEPYAAWVQTEQMTRVGGNIYTGRLKHFNYVNVGIGYPASFFEAQVVNPNNTTLTNSIIRTQLDSIYFGYDVIDDLGKISGYYPEQQAYELALLDMCSQLEMVAPQVSTGTVNLGQVTFTTQPTQITATLTCNGSTVNDFLILVDAGFNENYYYAFAGNTVSIPACSNLPHSITVIDPTTQLTQTVQINPGTINNLGTIELCNTGPTDYIQFDYDTTNYQLLNPVVDTLNNSTTILLNSGYLIFYGDSTGSYGGQALNDFNYDEQGTFLFGSMDTLIVTTFTNTSLIGTFKGNVLDTVSQNTVIVNGDFNIEL